MRWPTAWPDRASTWSGSATSTPRWGPQRSLYRRQPRRHQGARPDLARQARPPDRRARRRGEFTSRWSSRARRRFRPDDGVADVDLLPLGGGPAAVLRPGPCNERQIDGRGEAAGARQPRDRPGPARRPGAGLGHAGGRDLAVRPDRQPRRPAAGPCRRAQAAGAEEPLRRRPAVLAVRWRPSTEGFGRRSCAQDQLQVPIAGVSHWRREPEFAAAQASPGLDLIDDRLYWTPPLWIDPRALHAPLQPRAAALAAVAASKRQDRPPLRRRPVVPPDHRERGPTATRPPTCSSRRCIAATRGLGRPGPPRASSSIPRSGGRTPAGTGRRRGHLPDPRGRQRHPPGLQPLAARRFAHAPRETPARTRGRAAPRHAATVRRSTSPAGTRIRGGW